jgi:hypothetical protein
MATLDDLKTRIITELSRDDLEDTLAAQLTTHISRACEFYANQRFWFNAVVATASTTANVETVAIPAGVRRIDRMTIPASYAEVQEAILPDLDNVASVTTGRPTHYAYYNDSVRLYPVPDSAYTLRIYGLAQIDAPVDDTDENAWTEEAQDLIVSHTKMTLCRDQFRDAEGTQLAMGATQDALKRLQRETAQRLRTQLQPRSDAPWSRGRVDWANAG